MGEQYDDWGNPIRKYQPPDRSVAGIIKGYFFLITRKYRTLLATILFAICLVFYWNTESPTLKDPKVDWSKYAYVQYGLSHSPCGPRTNFRKDM